MQKKGRWIVLAVFCLLPMMLWANTPQPNQVLVGNPTIGKEKAAQCVACHGPDGNSVGPTFPKLAGQNERYFIRQMQAFKAGDQGGRATAQLMRGVVANLSDADIADLAAYFALQTPTHGQTESNLLALGQIIYRGGNLNSGVPACSACHGATGAGNAEAGYPALAGQQMDYVIQTLHNFREDKRSNDDQGIMRDIAKKMTEAEIKAVASYIAGLH